jgi:putative transposase
METVFAVAPEIGLASACRALGVSRATAYRHRSPTPPAATHSRRRSPLALSDEERAAVLAELHAERFVDASPAAVYATLLDEGTYLASERTMYRLLASNAEVRERRNQLRHPAYARPELLATGPNELWSWDITKLKGPATWTWFYLYVLLDVFSRYVPGWMVATAESAALAERLIADSVARQGIAGDQLTIHADRGSSMRSRPVALLLADLGIAKSHSRPHVSNDNPYSEAQFKTLKYRPGFPARFGSLEDARTFCRSFFTWYNTEHRHSGIALYTPADVHHGRVPDLERARADVLAGAYATHPERFVRRPPRPPELPTAVWINPPATKEAEPQ